MSERIVIEIDGDSTSARRALKQTADEVRRSTRQMQTDAARTAGVWQDAAGKWREANGRFVTSARKAELGLDAVAGAAQGAAQKTSAFGAMARKQQQTLSEFGNVARRTGAVLTASVAGGMAHVISTGAEYEQQMARVRAVTGATDEQFARLNDTAIRLGAETKFSAGEAAAAMYELASAGFSTDESIKALPGTLSLAASSGIDLAQAAEISSNALRGFQLDSSDSGKVADILAEAVNRSSVEMQDLGLSMKYIGPIASTTGQSLEDMIAAVSIMGDAGIKGEQAGTTLRAALIRLSAPTKATIEGFDQLGVSLTEFQGPNGLKPFPEIIRIVEERTRGMSQAAKNAALANIFGTEAASGMFAVVDSGAEKVDKLSKAYERSDGAAKRSADTMNRTVKGSFDALKGSIETVEIGLFQQFQEPLRLALLDAADVVNREGREVTDWFEEIFESREFQSADLEGKFRLLMGALGDEIDQADIPQRLGEAFSAALPVIAKAAGEAALLAAKSFAEGFVNADVFGRLVLATWLLNKTGGLAAFRAMGGQAGAATASGVAAGTAANSGKIKGALVGAVRAAGPGAAAAFALAFAPDLIKELQGRTNGLGDKLAESLGAVGDARLPQLVQDGDLTKLRAMRRDLDAIAKTEVGNNPAFQDLTRNLDDAITRVRSLRRISARGLGLGSEVDIATGDLAAIASAFENLERRSDSSMEEIRSQVRLNMRLISRSTKDGSQESKQALSRNFQLAAEAVRRSMEAGVISTKEGTAEIERLMRKALAQFGIKGEEATRYLSGRDTKTGKTNPTSGSTAGAARGGFWLGQPGAKGRDTVPMMVNGQKVIAAEGEYVGIFNRHQQRALNERLADQGGLAGFMKGHDRPHYMAGGGVVKANGGLLSRGVNLDGADPSLAKYAVDAARFDLQVTDGKRPAGTKTSSGGVSNHSTGKAIDLGGSVPNMLRYGLHAAKAYGRDLEELIHTPMGFGIKNGARVAPYATADHYDHVHLADVNASGGGAGGLGALPGSVKLKRTMWQGPGGMLGAIGQGGLDAITRAGQARLDEAGTLGGFDGSLPPIQSGAPGLSSAGGLLDKAAIKALWRQAGGSPEMANLMAAIALAESSGNPGITNSIGARGLWQVIPSTARGFGFDWNRLTDPLYNAQAAVAILKGQGLGAWDVYRSGAHTKFLAKGAIFADAGVVSPGNKKGGRSTRKKAPKKKAPKARNAKQLAGGLRFPYPEAIVDRIEALTGRDSTTDRALSQLRREHDRSDEEQMIAALNETNADGSFKVPQDVADREFSRIVAAHLAELQSQFGLADQMVAGFDDPKNGILRLSGMAVGRLESGIGERQTREKEIVGSVRANKQEIEGLLKQHAREKRKKKPNKGVLKQLEQRIRVLRAERRTMIGTTSIEGGLDDAGGMLGSTRDGLRAFKGALPEWRQKSRDFALDAVDRRADRQDIQDEITAWGGKTLEARATASADVSDNGLADLLRAENERLRKDQATESALLSVFQGMRPLLGERLVGAFAQGVDRVPATGLALVHKDETILPDPEGAFGLDQRMSRSVAPVVNVYVSGDIGPLMGKVRAEVDGRAVQVVSQALGRRSRTLAIAPGGR